MSTDPIMSGFLFLKAITNRYGPKEAADLVTLADRLVKQGKFPNRSSAVHAIEMQMGVAPTEALGKTR